MMRARAASLLLFLAHGTRMSEQSPASACSSARYQRPLRAQAHTPRRWRRRGWGGSYSAIFACNSRCFSISSAAAAVCSSFTSGLLLLLLLFLLLRQRVAVATFKR